MTAEDAAVAWVAAGARDDGAAFVVAIVGAESTGKTVLAERLEARFSGALPGVRVARVAEVLREFCERYARVPRQDEQRGIAVEQAHRIALAAQRSDVVLADTTPVMIAVYSDIVFGDRSLYETAESLHRRCDLTLLTALDLPWQADGLQRDGPHIREPVDALVRASLDRIGCGYSVVSGSGDERTEAAWRAIRKAQAVAGWRTGQDGASGFGDRRKRNAARSETESTTDEGTPFGAASPPPRWQAACEACGDPDCERKLFARWRR